MVSASVSAVLSNVGFVPLAAARRAGCPSIAFSSLNWHDVVQQACSRQQSLSGVLDRMAESYRSADCFLRLEPGLAMDWMETRRIAEVIAARGRDRRDELLYRIGGEADSRIVCFSFSETENAEPPVIPGKSRGSEYGILRLGPPQWKKHGYRSFADLGLPFIDFVWTSDLVVAKPGYGIAAEAALAGTPVLFVPRPGWPETTAILDWFRRHGQSRAIDSALGGVTAEDLRSAMTTLPADHPACPVKPGGEEAVAEALLSCVQ